MKLTPIIEMLNPAPGANLGAVAQTSDQSSLSFSDSLLAASKASSAVDPAANSISPKAARQQGSIVDDAKASISLPSRPAVQPATLPLQAALPQQVLPAKQTRSTNPTFTPPQQSLEDPVSTSDVATVVNDRPMANITTPRLPGTESTITRPGVFQLDMIQSRSPLQGPGLVQTSSILPGAKTQGIIAPIAPSSKTRKSASNAALTGASNSVPRPVQNVVPGAGPSEVQNSTSFLYAQPVTVPNTPSDSNLNGIQSVEAIAFRNAAQSSLSKAPLNGPSSPVPSDFSAAVSNAIQNAAPKTAPNEVQNPLSKEFPDMRSIAAPSIPPDAIQSAVPIGVGNAPSNKLQDPLPKTILSAPQNSGAGVTSNEVSNAVQNTTPNTAPNEVQNPLPSPVLSAPSNSVPSVRSNAIPNEVQGAASSADLNEVQNSVAKPVVSSAPSVPSAAYAIQAAVPNATLNEVQNPLPTPVLSAPSNSVPGVLSNANPNEVQGAAPDTVPHEVKNAVAKPFVSSAPSVPSAPHPIQAAVPNATPNEVQSPLRKPVLSAPSNSVPSVLSNATPNAVQGPAPNAAPNEVQNPLANPVLRGVPSTVPSVPSNTTPNAVHDTAPDTFPHEVQNPRSNAVPSAPPSAVPQALSNTDPGPVSVPHAAPNASAKGDIVSEASPVSTDHAVPPATASNLSAVTTGLSTLGSTADQFVALTQLSGRLMGTGWAGVSNLNPPAAANSLPASGNIDKGGIKDAASTAAGPKPHVQSASDLAGYQTGSQSVTSGDQNQSGPSSQAQNAAAAPMIVANHTVAAVADAQNAATASPVHIAPTPTGVTGSAGKTPDTFAHTSVVVPQALPVINTAKLIQTMGQSEMRVGMRTNEFGNISIRTSTTRDLISAQISLDHAELARTLATHLPEMQARLGSNQVMDVRIDMNGNGAAQGAGTSGGTANGSSDQSREGRQQAGTAGSSYAGNTFAERQFPPVTAANTTGDGRLGARLDIRV